MSAQTEVIDSIEAVQSDRKAAADANKPAEVTKLFEALVKPLNQQLARMAFDAKPELTEMQLTLKVLDDGLQSVTGAVDEAHLVNSHARAEQLRAKLSAGIEPPPTVNPDIPSTPPVAILDSPNPVPAGPAGEFVTARKTGTLSVTYIDGAGREVVRQGGSRSWRNNNPGNIRRGNFAENHRSIGDDGTFAIFPDADIGLAAIVSLLRSPTYGVLTLEGAINRYAPPSENNTTAYVDFVSGESGVATDKVLDDLLIAEIRKIAGAIKKMEGWTAGTEHPNTPLSGAMVAGVATGGVSSAVGAQRDWMAVAEREAALPARERSAWVDPEENPRILEYFRVAAAWFENIEGDETDWCAAFVNYCLVTSGHVGTDHPGARSFFWNKKNQFVSLSTPSKGCIAVRRYAPFSDKKWKEGKGHVGFVVGSSADSITLLGGNQGNTVCRKTFPLETQDSSGKVTSKFVAFMMPVMN